MNCILLISSTNCKDCEKFEDEWEHFQENFQKQYGSEFPPNFIKKILYNPMSATAIEDRKKVLKYAQEGKDGYPLLLFYVNGRRWKPYWFNSREFRTSKVLMFTFLILYKILPSISAIPDHLYFYLEDCAGASANGHCDNLIGMKKILNDTAKFISIYQNDNNNYDDDEDEFYECRNLDLDKHGYGLYCHVNWNRIKHDMEEQLSSQHTDEERKLPNYPTIERIMKFEEKSCASKGK